MLHVQEEAARCLLCEQAPCGEHIARAIRAIRFDNEQNAWRFWADVTDSELQAAENQCIHYDKPIRIAELKKCIENASLQDSAKVPEEELPSLELNF